MTKLQCTVTNCYYNEDKCCCKGDIMVEGREAMDAGQTCCSSFREKNGAGKNAVSSPKNEIKVDCHACNCVHNEDCKCTAEHIGIGGNNACQCEETECMTFYCK